MADFSFTATAECDYCGNLLSSSDEECDECDESDIHQHFFKRLTAADDDDIITVRATTPHKWHRLEEEMGDDWIGYAWLGTRDAVDGMMRLEKFDEMDELPAKMLSYEASSAVGE